MTVSVESVVPSKCGNSSVSNGGTVISLASSCVTSSSTAGTQCHVSCLCSGCFDTETDWKMRKKTNMTNISSGSVSVFSDAVNKDN
jgi:hypothetical protein